MKPSASRMLASCIVLSFVATSAWCAENTKVQQKSSAQELFKEGKYAEAQTAFETIISEKRNAEVKEQRQYAELLLQYGRTLFQLRKYDQSYKMLKQAEAIAESFALPSEFLSQIRAEVQQVEPNITDRTNHYNGYSSYNQPERRDAAEEEHLLKSSIEYTKERFGAGSMAYLDRHIAYARFLSNQQRPDDLNKEASAIREAYSKMPAASQAQTAPQMLEFASTLGDAKLPLVADTVGSIVLASIESGALKNETRIAQDFDRLASSFERGQNNDLAQKYYAAAVRAFEKQVPADDPHLAQMRVALAQYYHKVGKNAAAIELLEMAVAAQTKNVATGEPQAISALATLTELYAGTNNIAKAKECSDKIAEALVHTATEANLPFKELFESAGYLAMHDDLASSEKLYTATLKAMKNARNRSYSEYETQRLVKELAGRFAQKGNADAAERVYDNWIAYTTNSLGKPTAASVNAYLDKAQLYLDQENFEKLGTTALQAVELNSRFQSNQDHRLSELARLCMERKQYDVALKLEQAWLDNADNGRHQNAYQIADAKNRIARIYHATGNDAAAGKMLSELLDENCARGGARMEPIKPILQEALNKLIADKRVDSAVDLSTSIAQSLNYSQPYDGLIQVSYQLVNNQMYDLDLRLLQVCLDGQSTMHGPSSSQAGMILREQARVLQLQGENAKAADLQTSAESIFALLQKQQQTDPNGTNIYNPKAPLAETVKAAAPLSNQFPSIRQRPNIRVINLRAR